MKEELLENRERNIEIQKLNKGIKEVSDLFSDMALLVNYQGEAIDNIQINIENSLQNTDSANKELKKATKYNTKNNFCFFKVIGFIIFISVIIIIIIII